MGAFSLELEEGRMSCDLKDGGLNRSYEASNILKMQQKHIETVYS